MANYQIAYNKAVKKAVIQSLGDALPANEASTAYVNIGTFEHADVEAAIADLEFDVNHVFYQHVRDALYKRSAANPAVTAMFPENITDMAGITILQDTTYVALVSFVLAPDPVTLTVASPTQQLSVTPTPGGASNIAIASWVSSDPTKATVSATGLVTRVANGTTTITATSVDGALTDTLLITCTA